MAKQRKHQGLRADGKLRKGFKYSGKRNKNGTARIVKVVQKKKMKGGIFGFKRFKGDKNIKPKISCEDAQNSLSTLKKAIKIAQKKADTQVIQSCQVENTNS